ncbi:MAG: ATP synthase F1 subunit gamma [Patescibacteria group bacterium]|nr:ATP synthase F1 subunit gamma [Patescibacteria group bacterium]
MANLKQLRLRIKSVKNTAKITRTMSMIAASKMRKAQLSAMSGRAYKNLLTETLTKLLGSYGKKLSHPFFESNSSKAVCVFLISTDRGLCGSLNTSLFKSLANDPRINTKNTAFFASGKKGISYLSKLNVNNLKTVFVPEEPNKVTAELIAKQFSELFLNGSYSKIYLAYNQFISTLKQAPVLEQLLPFESKSDLSFSEEPILEPSKEKVLDYLAKECLQANVLQALLDAKASEHSARMVAMQSATDNAKKLADDLTLFANRARQEAITRELLDMAGSGEE